MQRRIRSRKGGIRSVGIDQKAVSDLDADVVAIAGKTASRSWVLNAARRATMASYLGEHFVDGQG
jgi:hypothetical protein